MSEVSVLKGQEVPTIVIPRTQVYMATHDGEGNRLPYRYRSFISFKFDDKWIEDFNFVAFVDGDRMQRNLTADFEDLTSSYDVLDGQFYHSTHFRTNTIHFVLMSDEVDGRLMENFKNWLSPGKTAELVLSEYPNRAIMARIAQPPEMSMLPFEKKVELTIANTKYETSVTNFKGTVDVEFVMDEPFWYSIINIFGKVTSQTNGIHIYENSWEDCENFYNDPDVLKDVLKIVYEDGIPLYHMIASPMLFGNDVYAASGSSAISFIYQPIEESDYKNEPGYHQNDIVYNNPSEEESDFEPASYWIGGVIQDSNNSTEYTQRHGAIIAGAHVTTTTNSNLIIPVGNNNALNLYYTGTAPAPIKLDFTISIGLDSNGYVNTIASDAVPINNKTYNTITFESVKKQELRITAPNFITSYNKVIEILNHNTTRTYEQLREEMRDEVRHPVIRAMIIAAINQQDPYYTALIADPNTNQLYQEDRIVSTTQINGFIDSIKNVWEIYPSLHIHLDSKTGEATGEFFGGNSGDSLVENVGDMFDSNYLLLRDRNVFDDQMQVSAWTEQHTDYSYRVYHDFPVELSHVSIEYKNMYY